MAQSTDERALSVQEIQELLREVEQIAARGEARRGDAAAQEKRRSRLQKLRELAGEAVQAEARKVLVGGLAVAIATSMTAGPSTEVLVERTAAHAAVEILTVPTQEAFAQAALAIAAAIANAEAALNECRAEVRRLLEVPGSGKESDAITVGRLNVAVERERTAAQHVEALRKIDSDQRIAALGLAIKQLEGEQQKSLEELKAANDRAAAAQAQANNLALERRKGINAWVVAAIGILAAAVGGVVGAKAQAAKDPPAGASAPTSVASPPTRESGVRDP